MVCDNCMARGWASDGKRLVLSRVAPPGGHADIGLLDPATGQFQAIFPQFTNYPKTSWDDRWLTFYSSPPGNPTQSLIFVLPIYLSGETPKSEIIAVTDGQSFDFNPEFSPNGKLLYFQSMRDGSRCIWAIRLDPATKRPQGAPFPVYHFHGARQSMTNVQLRTTANAVARDKVVYTSVERTGNIWMLTE
jgi:Tol biopolymer transport system component